MGYMAPLKPTTRSNSSSREESMTVDDKLNLLLEEVRQVKEGNAAFMSEFSKVKDDLKILKEDLNKSLDMCFGKISDFEQSVGEQSKRISTCETIIENVKSENVALKKTVSELKKKVAAGEQYSRSNCLEINGVPETRSENIFDVVKQVAKVLNFRLEEEMIDAVHRLAKNPNKPEAPRGIILKFCRRVDMEEMRRRARVRRSISAGELGYDSESRIFVNLSLGRETRQLWSEVRNFKEQHGYKYAWISSAGKIFLRKMENGTAFQVSEVSDLQLLK